MTNPQRVWITGASSGFGAALARACAARGDEVLLSARPSEKLDAVCADLPGPGRGEVYAADLTNDAQLDATISRILENGGIPDLVILNAGTYTPMGLDDFSTAAMRELFALNFFAIAATIERLVPSMRARGRGHIAVVGSVAGDIGLPYAGAYSASKAALMRLAQALRPEMQRAGLDLSVINPGFIRTPLTDKNDFPMPFLIDAERAAAVALAALARREFEIRFPWRMSVAMRLLANLPDRLSAALTRRMLKP